MNLLLDTHTLLWAVDDYDQISPLAHAALASAGNNLFISTATVWEVAIKVGVNKLSLSLPFRDWMIQSLSDLSLSIIPLNVEHADVLSSLPMHHRDPFDRVLVAQAMVDGIPLVSCDAAFDSYGINRIW